MVNAFSLGLKEKDGQGDYSKKSLLAKIKKELSDNEHRYSGFDDIKKEDLNAYIKKKKYNLSLVDLIPHVVANFTNTSILILEVRNGQVHTTPIHPKPEEGSPEKNGKTGEKPEKEERAIYVYKTGDHYDAILDREEAASGLKVEGKPDIVVCSFPRIQLSGIDISFWLILTKTVFSPLIASFFHVGILARKPIYSINSKVYSVNGMLKRK